VRTEDLDQLILDIHSATLQEEHWSSVLDAVRGAVGAQQGMLFSLPRRPGEAFWHVLSESDPAMPAEYAQEFAPEDAWRRASGRLPGPLAGRVLSGEELLPRSEFLSTRFFNEFLRRYDIDRFVTTVLRDAAGTGGAAANLSLYRGSLGEAFSGPERAILARLSPHLRTALDTFWSVRSLSLRNAALSGTLEKITAALIVLDRAGCVMFENGAARRELSLGELLCAPLGRLEPSSKIRESRACREAFRALLLGRSTTVRLTHPSSGRTAILTTAPLSEALEVLELPRCGAGFVWLIPAIPTANPARRMGELFELTQAEERLLAALSAGVSINEAAESFRISVHTARCQLKALQRKTGWRTQSELIRVMQQVSFIEPGPGSPD
jgi:DNA-binding CsgD family transcriptional regulator/PAS domain-containing protein